jgi:hypothetical protein
MKPLRRISVNRRELVVLVPLLAFLLVAARTSGDSKNSPGAPPIPRTVDSTTIVQMQNVDFFVDPQIPLRIRALNGKMRSRAGGPIVFDDKRSFVISVDAANVGLTGPALSVLLNKYVFGFKGSPLTNLRVTMSGNHIIQKGTLHKVASMPFEIRAELSVTPDGRIRIHPIRTEILGLHVDKLMKGLGLSLEKIVNLSRAKGATVDGNDIFLSPNAILPPPEIEGRVTAVRIEGDQLMMTYGSAATVSRIPVPDPAAANYMYYRGGTLQFGKLMMLEADMFITDLDPADAFRFDLDRYQPQLVAGYSRTLASGGLEVWMRDIDKLGRGKPAVSAPSLR